MSNDGIMSPDAIAAEAQTFGEAVRRFRTERGLTQEKLAQALRKVMADDPTLRINSDVQTGRTIVRGTDELQLETIVNRYL